MDFITLSLAKKYVNDAANALGAVKGANCTIESITPTDGGNNVVFAWTGTDGTKQTQTMFVASGKSDSVLYTKQELTEEQKAQARENIGAYSGLISILDADPAEPKEGQMWILKTPPEKLTTPVIELGEVSENSIEIKLSNASFDGSGAVVASYNIYVNGELNKTENIAAGGTCVVAGLSAETEYRISVCGVKNGVLSEVSNALTATTLESPDIPDEPDNICVYTAGEGDCVDTYGLWPKAENGNIYLYAADAGKAAILSLTGDKAYASNVEVQGIYYPLAVPADAVSVTVECPNGTQYSYNGYTVTDGKYERTIDSGYKNPGVTCAFEAGKCQYCHVYIKKTSGSFSGGEIAGTTVTFV